MKRVLIPAIAAACFALAGGAYAHGEAEGATAACNDGTYSHEPKALACTLHKGIKTWYGDKGPPTVAAPGTGAGPAVAGAPGVVWANTRSRHYHCKGDVWYGHTRKGMYMYEADAVAQGFKPDHKACTR